MAKLKPMNPTVNYEAAWEELKKGIGKAFMEGERNIFYGRQIKEIMDDLEKKHKNLITLKRRSNPEIVDYCIKKSVEVRMENIHLKKELRELKRNMIFRNIGYSKFIEKSERKLFNVHLVCVTGDDLQFVFNWHVTEKKSNYLRSAHLGRKEISWHGLKMRIMDLKISYSGGGNNE